MRARAAQRYTQRLVEEGNSISDIARLCGVSRPTVYAWLEGQPPHNANLARLAELCGDAVPTGEDIDVLTGRRMTPE